MQSIRLLPGTADSLNYQAAAERHRCSRNRFRRKVHALRTLYYGFDLRQVVA
jgi:hypothetical protein